MQGSVDVRTVAGARSAVLLAVLGKGHAGLGIWRMVDGSRFLQEFRTGQVVLDMTEAGKMGQQEVDAPSEASAGRESRLP